MKEALHRRPHGTGPRPAERVVIVGGGPAGSATARALRRLAPNLADCTILLERAPGKRNKLCGGGITGACVRELHALGLELRVPSVTIHRGVFLFDDQRREFHFESPSFVVRRDAFDDDLLHQVEGDVEVHRGEALLKLHRAGDGLYVETDRRLYRARLVIGADGVGSRVRRFLFAERRLSLEPVIRLFQADVPQPSEASRTDAMTFDFSVLRDGLHGYFWTFPSHRDDARVMNTGVMHLPPYDQVDAKQVLRDSLRRHSLPLPDSLSIGGYPELAYDPRRPIGGDNLLLVGDAAGIEPLTGEGLAQCIAYGTLAAAFARARLESGDTRFHGFTGLVARSSIGREMHAARRLARRLYGPDWPFWIDLFLARPAIGRLLALQVQGRDYLYRHLPRLLVWFLAHKLRTSYSRTTWSSNAEASPGPKAEPTKIS